MGTNHESSFAKCPGLFQFYVQFEHFFLKKIPVKRFSAIFHAKALRKANLKIHWYWAFQQEAGIAAIGVTFSNPSAAICPLSSGWQNMGVSFDSAKLDGPVKRQQAFNTLHGN